MTCRRFIIGIDGLSPDQEAEFRVYVGDLGAWWHWIGNLWLLTTHDENISAKEIRKKIRRINHYARVIVLETPESLDWAASASVNSKGDTIYGWLNSVWDKE
jgi:hypothetical protein